MNDGNPETGVTLRGVDRTYRIDCRSLNALARLEDETGLSLVAVLDAIREDDPPDLTLARQFLGAVNAFFEVADARQVLIELLAIGPVQHLFQRMGVFQHGVEHAGPQAAALQSVGIVRLVGEEPFEDQFGIDLGGERRGGVAPSQRVLIDARIAAVAVAGATEGLDAQFE